MQRIHFIGICGTAMATVAAMLKARGWDVRGSDQGVYPPMSDFLREQGIQTMEGYRAEHITPDLTLVCVGNAISRGNPELETVLERKIRYCSLPELVRDQFLWSARSIVVAGTHGKTTTTSLIGWMLTSAGRDPSVLVGGIAGNFGAGFRLGGGRDFVIEGDEYDSAFFDKTAKFLKYLPDIAIVNNLEFDHADIYADVEAVELAFRRLTVLVPRNGLLLLGADNPRAAALAAHACSPVETFGLEGEPTWKAGSIEVTSTGTRFRAYRNGTAVGTFEIPLLGQHNVRNALAAIAVGATLEVDVRQIVEGLRSFAGVKRRLELRGSVDDIRVYDDFAHHPTAVAETLSALRLAHPGRRLWAIFEPRSASACLRVFQNDFVDAFETADEVVVAPVFRTKVAEDRRLSPAELVAELKRRGRSARHAGSTAEIVEQVAREAESGDLIVVMSNGGFDNIHDKLLDALRARFA
ncbi:MAG TPA: UDP-N-acetylmuramate:L-alanyl-gamma-D-glutamyl-meso-diaminopimelate ligase [Vicinamibacterales bacterium]